MKLTKNAVVTVDITAEEMATLWWERMNGEEQARFFNKLYELCHRESFGGSKEYDFLMQLQYITDNRELNKGGRWVMEQIGNYAQKPEQ